MATDYCVSIFVFNSVLSGLFFSSPVASARANPRIAYVNSSLLLSYYSYINNCHYWSDYAISFIGVEMIVVGLLH